MITHTRLLFLRNDYFHSNIVKIWYFGGHFVLRRYLKMLNADRVSAGDLLKLMVSGSQIHKKTNYSETKQV